MRPDDDDEGESVTLIAERADTSARTIYRILAGTTHTLSLSLADHVVLACDSHLMDCRLEWPDGTITDYLD